MYNIEKTKITKVHMYITITVDDYLNKKLMDSFILYTVIKSKCLKMKTFLIF